ncbi:MAG: hypothetical protein J6U96_05605 [Elusimicrobiaceae bacterium]|nr:hypothetical protein [Elusimicrobiaceae bacterium]
MRYAFLAIILFAGNLYAAALPDNIYFRAMQDEMQRSKKELHLPGEVKPFYIVYRIEIGQAQVFVGKLGALVSQVDEKQKENTPQVQVSVYLYAGDSKQNSSGLEEKNKTFSQARALNSYESLRDNLWYLTDREYIRAAKRAEHKDAIKRNKQLPAQEPEFSRAPQAQFVDELTDFEPRSRADYNKLVQELSAQGKRYDYLESYGVRLMFGQKQSFFLDSEGNFSQVQTPQNTVTFSAKFRNQDGLEEDIVDFYVLPLERAEEEPFIRRKAAQFLQYTQRMHEAKKGDFYTGPVLLVQDGVAQFLERLLINNLRNTKPLLMESNLEDPSVGKLTKKVGRRIMSTGLDVTDKPQQRAFNGLPLLGFRPVDSEGVAAQELQVVENGKLKEIPTLRSLLPGQKQSNGHAYTRGGQYPRATLSNVFISARQPLPQMQLEEKLMNLCRAQELEYCYIIHSWQGRGGLNIAERIYTADGRREWVYGLAAEQENDTRALRDIVTAGDKAEVFSLSDMAIVAPELLINEIDLKPIERDPDRPHFVPQP